MDKPDPLNAGFIDTDSLDNDIDDKEVEYNSEKTRNLNENIYELNSKLCKLR